MDSQLNTGEEFILLNLGPDLLKIEVGLVA